MTIPMLPIVDLTSLTFGSAVHEMGFREGRASLSTHGVRVAFVWDNDLIQRSEIYQQRAREYGYFLAR